MALTVKQIIAAKRPGTPDDSRLDALIELAAGRTSSTVFGDNYNLAVALRTLHQIELFDSNNGAAGGVTSRSEGQLSIGYGGAGGNASDLGATAWGVELSSLIRANVRGPIHRAMAATWAPQP